jgi:AAA+ ATPase superfamily predicted ATPase
MDFFNREKELKYLDDIYRRKGAQFLALYGRRRIGKTALINNWIQRRVKKRYVYWVAHRSSSKILLKSFSQALLPLLNTSDKEFSFSSWETALENIATIAKQNRAVIVIDELPYLIEAAPAFTSILQAQWDQSLNKSKVFLFLCGSHFHMMQDELISKKGPLYGRTTADLLLDEILPEDISCFLPRYSKEQIVETFSIIGGVPKYLEMWNDKKSVIKNIEELILSPITIFRQEPVFLIQDEISDVRTYLAVLESIGSGMSSQKSIAEKSGIALPNISKYLHVLSNLGFIRRIISVDAPNQSNTRMTSYEIRDAYLRFYFCFVQPNLPLLEQQRYHKLLEIIKERFTSYIARNGFEELCRRFIIARGDRGDLPFEPRYVGRIWNRSTEIDIAAIDPKNKNVLLGECKWTTNKMNEKNLETLKMKAGKLKNISRYNINFVLFSKSGFTRQLEKIALHEKVMLYEGAEFIEKREG